MPDFIPFQILEWRMCSRCIIGKHYQCNGGMKAEGLKDKAYRPCECECND